MKLYIMRHGETDWNRQGMMQGSTDIPLNPYGIELAEQTRDGFLNEGVVFDRIFSSPLVRAAKTAQIIADGYGLPIKTDLRVQEMGFGKFEGAVIHEIRSNPKYEGIKAFFIDPANYIPVKGAESYEDVVNRLNSFLTEEIYPLETTCSNILIVCHGAVMRCFDRIIAQTPLRDFWAVRQPNCCINVTEIKDGKIHLLQEGITYYTIK